ncbi:hypothetical protein F442_22096 [Phytophthora nicotianae P10297]|uniref:Uncharacterized protein n=1 Tax=Phytophthora nicotianae P10297 TaxID=1317064 RepID=W2Y0W7_PHYNI|nr:hypothetical protein F442_22096 [Phytophthora nicotianae P10297]
MLIQGLGQTQFDSWKSFHAYLNKYMAQTYQIFRFRTNNKVQERNRKIKKQNATAPLITEGWIWYNKTLVCSHAGKCKTRGKGKRPRQEVRSTECCAQVCILFVWAQMGKTLASWAQMGTPDAGWARMGFVNGSDELGWALLMARMSFVNDKICVLPSD